MTVTDEPRLSISNLTIADYDVVSRELAQLEEQYPTVFTKDRVLEEYTSMRYYTSIDQTTGTAMEGTLHNSRVLNKGLTFKGHIDVEDMTDTDRYILSCAVRNMTGIGGKRNRGFGQVVCKIDDEAFDGRILRGLFATQFIKSHNLGKTAHTNKDFMDLFYGDLRFVSAYKDTVKGTSFPAPLSLQKNKNAAKETKFASNTVVDSFYAKQEYDVPEKQNLLGFKGVKGFIVLDGTECSPVVPLRLATSRLCQRQRVQAIPYMYVCIRRCYSARHLYMM